MSNMSYCRFTNTLADLQDCREALEDNDLPTSPEEIRASCCMLEECSEILAIFGIGADPVELSGAIEDLRERAEAQDD